MKKQLKTGILTLITINNQAINLNAPSSKSVTNRALLLASLYQSETNLKNVLLCEDTRVMIDSLEQLGANFETLNNNSTIVKGIKKFSQPTKPLYIANSGTTARFLTAACCLADHKITIIGNAEMSLRPIGELVTALKSIGFNITAVKDNFFPINIYPRVNTNINSHVIIDSSKSSQFTSALMMIAPKLPNGLKIELKNPTAKDGSGYLELTVDILKKFGIKVESPHFGSWSIYPSNLLGKNFYQIEPDYSACTYFWAAEKLSGLSVTIQNSKMESTIQPDASAYELIQKFPNLPPEINGSQIQDAIPTLAVLAAFNNNPVRFTGIKNLRVKECDRIDALKMGLNNLKKGLAEVVNHDLTVYGQPNLKQDNCETHIDTFKDHRIAMSFALMAFKLDGIIIKDSNCVDKTFPNYWKELRKLGIMITN